MSEDILLDFVQKCGNKLTKIYFDKNCTIHNKFNYCNKFTFTPLIKLCLYLISIGGVNSSDLLETNEEQNKTISLNPKLQ
jgi:hypothetical protein